MRSLIPLALVVAAFGSGPAGPALGATDPAEAAGMLLASEWVTLPSGSPGRWDLRCTTDDPVATMAVGWRYIDRGDNAGAWLQVTHGGTNGAYVRVGEQETTLVPVSPIYVSRYHVFDRWEDEPIDKALRFDIASWGGSMDCSLVVNGVEQTLRPRPRSDARYVAPESLERTAGARAQGATAIVQAGYAHEAKGFLFARVDGGIGRTTVTFPDGSSGSSLWGVALAEPTDGWWRYDFEAVASPWGAGIWILVADL